MIEAVCGKKINTNLIQQVNQMAKRSGGNSAAKYASHSIHTRSPANVMFKVLQTVKAGLPTTRYYQGFKTFCESYEATRGKPNHMLQDRP